MPLDYALYCQSPALFWCALALIVCFFLRRSRHRVRAVLDLILGLLCLLGGVALYYLGLYYEQFTIRDFWQIRVPGWVGLGLALLLTLWVAIRAAKSGWSARRTARQAQRREEDHLRELEEVRQRAYTSGQEDARAADRVAEHVAAAVEPPVDPAPTPNGEV